MKQYYILLFYLFSFLHLNAQKNNIYVFKFSPLDLINIAKPSVVVGVEKWNLTMKKSKSIEIGYIIPRPFLYKMPIYDQFNFQGFLLRYENKKYNLKNEYYGYTIGIGYRQYDYMKDYSNYIVISYSPLPNTIEYYSQFQQKDFMLMPSFNFGKHFVNFKRHISTEIGLGIGFQYFISKLNNKYIAFNSESFFGDEHNPNMQNGLGFYLPIKLKFGLIYKQKK